MVKAKCIACGKTVKARDEWSGRAGNCPGCGEPIYFPPHFPAALSSALSSAPVEPDQSATAQVAAPPTESAQQHQPPQRVVLVGIDLTINDWVSILGRMLVAGALVSVVTTGVALVLASILAALATLAGVR